MCGLFLCEIIKGFHHYHFSYFYFFSQFFRLLGWFYNIPKEIDIEFLRYPISRTLTIRNPLS